MKQNINCGKGKGKKPNVTVGAFGFNPKKIEIKNKKRIVSWERKYEPFDWRSDLPTGQKTWKPNKKK